MLRRWMQIQGHAAHSYVILVSKRSVNRYFIQYWYQTNGTRPHFRYRLVQPILPPLDRSDGY